MNECSYEREDRIRNIVSRVFKYTLLTLFGSFVTGFFVMLLIIAPVQTFSILAFMIVIVMLAYLWLWCVGLVNICERPPEADAPLHWRDIRTGVKHQWIKDDAIAEGGLWVPVYDDEDEEEEDNDV